MKNAKKSDGAKKAKPAKNQGKKEKAKKPIPETAIQFERLENPFEDYAEAEREREMKRALFYMEYERTCGNVLRSCAYAGIGRATAYRWMEGDKPHHLEFQRRLKEIRPVDVLLDKAEYVLDAHLNNGSLAAAQFVLTSPKAKSRGYIESGAPAENAATQNLLVEVASLIKQFLAEKPHFDRAETIRTFARKNNLDEKQLEEMIKNG